MTNVRSFEELDQDDYMQIVKADLHDKASEAGSAALRASEGAVREWRDALKELKMSIEMKLVSLRVEVTEEERASRLRGRDQAEKDKFFRWKAGKDQERLRLIGFKRLVEMRLQETKALLAETSDTFSHRLDKILAVLGEVQADMAEVRKRLPL